MASSAEMFSDLPFERPQQFIAVWGGLEGMTGVYGGDHVNFPPRDKTVKAGHGIYRFGSALDQRGQPIPGTLLLEDSIEFVAETNENRKVFAAADWLKGLKQTNKLLFARGLAIVNDPADVPAALNVCIPRWEQAKAEEWHTTIRDEISRRKLWESKGQPAPPLDDRDLASLRDATEGLKRMGSQRRETISTDALIEAIGGPVAKPTPTAAETLERELTALPAQVEDKAAEEAETLRQVARDLLRLAHENNVKLTNAQQAGLFDRDAAVIKEVADKLEAAGVEVG